MTGLHGARQIARVDGGMHLSRLFIQGLANTTQHIKRQVAIVRGDLLQYCGVDGEEV